MQGASRPVRIAVLDDFQRVAEALADWSSIPDAQVEFFHDALKDQEALARRLAPFHVVCMMRERTRFPAALLERLPNLRLLCGTGGRQTHVDFAAAGRRGIAICGTVGGRSGQSTAEVTWGLILCLSRQIPWEDRAVREGRWQTRPSADLSGKTLGILGLGRIGSTVAGYGTAFGMDVIAWGPTLTEERAVRQGVTFLPKDEVFRRSDFLSIHLQLSDMSRGLVKAGDLALMKRTAYLVNTARSQIVEAQALLEALRNGTIAGAGMDVFDEEPLPAGHPLTRLDNVVLTPHLGYSSREALADWYPQTVENIKAFLAGTPQNVQNPEALGKG
jgi:phosphoglycerate dehydrogenase-like enzyme